MIRIGPYAKAVESAVGNIILVGTFLGTVLTEVAPRNDTLAYALSALSVVLGVTNTFRVWLVKNEPLIEQAFDAGEDLVHDLEAGRHSLGSTFTVESQLPTGSVQLPAQAPGFQPGPGGVR